MLSMIVAHDRLRAIGRAGDMPWHVPEDLRYFRRTTLGKPVIMGRGTWKSIGEKPLPGRQNLIVTSVAGPSCHADAEFVSLSTALAIIDDTTTEIFCIGGGRLYAELMPRAERLYITKLDLCVDSPDTWFPEYPNTEWDLLATEDLMAQICGAIAHTYERREPATA